MDLNCGLKRLYFRVQGINIGLDAKQRLRNPQKVRRWRKTCRDQQTAFSPFQTGARQRADITTIALVVCVAGVVRVCGYVNLF